MCNGTDGRTYIQQYEQRYYEDDDLHNYDNYKYSEDYWYDPMLESDVEH
jgi:hypothetical protein